MQEVLKKLQDSNTKQSTQILKLNESVTTIYKKVDSTDSTISKLYKEQIRANNAAEAAAKRAASDAKRKSADNPLKRMFEKQEKKQKKGNDLLAKILAALAGLGALGGVVKGIFDGAKDQLIKTLGNIFGKDGFIRTQLARIFGEKGFLRTQLGRIFGKNGFFRTQLGKIFGKNGFLRTQLGRIFGKDSFIRKGIGKIFGEKGFLRTSISKLFNKLGSLLPKGLKETLTKTGAKLIKGAGGLAKGAAALVPGADTIAKGAGGIAKGAAGLAKGAGSMALKGAGGIAKGAGSMALKGAGGLANFALKRGPFAALFAAGDELLGEDPKLGRAAARGGGAAAGAGIGASIGSIVPVVGTIIGGALGASLGDFLGGFLYDNFSDLFKPLDDFGTEIGEKFNEIKKGFTDWWSGVSETFNKIKKGFTDWWTDVGQTFNNIKEGITNWWSGITTTFNNVKEGIGKLWTDISTTVSGVVSEIGSVLEIVTRPYREFIGEAARLGKNLFEIGKGLVTGYVKFLNSIRVKVTDFVAWYFKTITDFAGKAIGFVDDKILKPIKSGFDELSKFLRPVTDLLGKLAGGILDGVVSVFEKISNFFGSGGGKSILETASNLNPLNLLTSAVSKLNDNIEGNKTLPERSSGGWISGPQSGYPVSLDGGKSASFIGHGTEYVAQRSSGGFVVPVDTPHTRSNPGLTQQRVTEATGSGFNLSGMKGYSAGGVIKHHPHTGEGHNPSNAKDAQGRPVILSKDASTSFTKMMNAGGVNPIDVASSQRSTDYNHYVKGAQDSNHLSGNAIDIHGGSKIWLRQGNDKKYGWKWLDYSGHDGHFDYVKGSGDTTPKKEGEEDKEKGNDKKGGLFGGPAGLLGSSLGWLGNILGLGKFGDAFKKGYLEGAAPGGIAMQLFDMFMKDDSTSSNSSGGSNSDIISGGNSSLGSGGGSLTKMTDQQWSDLAYAVSGEAQPNTDDDFGVAANILTRVADPNYPNTIMGVFTQPKQYAAYTDGGARRDDELAARLKANQGKIVSALKELNGRQSFKGTSQYKHMGPGDIKFSDRGNFYHYASQHSKSDPAPSSPPQHWKKFIEEEGGDKSTKSEGNKVDKIMKGVPGNSWLQNQLASPAASGHLGDAIRSELQNKPVGSELVIANSSETIIPQGKIKGIQTSNDWIDSSMNNSSQPTYIIVNTPQAQTAVPIAPEPGVQTPTLPAMSSGPTSPLAGLLMTQTYLLADRIG